MTRMIGFLLVALLATSPAWAGKISARSSATTPTGAETLGIIQSGVDKKILLQSLPGQYYNIETNGAVGNGSTDDTTNIQTALTYCSNTGSTCVLQTGKTYKVTSALYIWGKANLMSWKTTSTAFGSFRIAMGAEPYPFRVGISGVDVVQEPWSGTIKNVDFTIVSTSIAPPDSGRILFFFRSDGGTVTGCTGDASTFPFSLTSAGNNAAVLANVNNYIRKNLTLTFNTFVAVATVATGSEGIGLGEWDGALIAHNNIQGVGDDVIGVHYSTNVTVRDNYLTSVHGRLFVVNCLNCVVTGNTHVRAQGSGAWNAGIALIYIGHESTAANSHYAPQNNLVANNLLIYPSGAVDNGGAITIAGARQTSIIGNTIVNNSATVTAGAVVVLPFVFVGAWTDPTGLDTTVARLRDITIAGNVSTGAYPQGMYQTGLGTSFLGSFVVSGNTAKSFAFYAPATTDLRYLNNGTGQLTVVPYSASITPDASTCPCVITVTDTNAFAMKNPVNSVTNTTYQQGMTLTFLFIKTGAGATGTITWDAEYRVAGGATGFSVGSATNKSITFINTAVPNVSDGWTELYRGSADIDNAY